MADQPHASFQAVFGDRLDIEVGIGIGEAEDCAVVKPVAVPARVPTFNEYAVEAVLCREIDVAFGLLGGCAVIATGPPGLLLDVPRPPDANVLPGFDPGDVTELVRLVEIQDQV